MNLSVQFMTMAAMAVMGLWIGISVDTYGRFFYRSGRRRWNIVQIAGDLVFWLLQGLLVFYVLLNVNQGDVRIYIFLALLCGYAAYKSLFQSLYLRGLEGIIKTVRFFFGLLKKIATVIFVRPVQLLWRIMYTVTIWFVHSALAILLFFWKIVAAPLKWLVRLIVPEAVLKMIRNFFSRIAGIRRYMKKITNKVKAWLGKSD
jgi:spore cortex biosynthesis protein YabQ